MTRPPGPTSHTRRALLTAGLGVAVGATGGAAAASAVTGAPSPVAAGAAGPSAALATEGAAGRVTVPFHGPHQAGVSTPARAHATWIALDLRPGTDRAALVRLLRVLSDDAARLMRGVPALADTAPNLARVPAGLSLTFGFGPGLFAAAGLDDARPPSVRELPPFPGERLEARWSGGDLLVHVEADDAATVSHAVRTVTLDARRTCTGRWVQSGFRPAAGTLPGGATMRNLFDQVDGTVNPAVGSPDFDATVWASAGPAWFEGGTVCVVRRIRFDLDTWDAFDPAGKETVLGRRLADGAPLTGQQENDVPDLDAVDALGFPVIEDTAHIRLAHATTLPERMLRRGANYDAGPGPDGAPDAGLLFVAYQADADTAFVPVQRRLAASDAMNRWITHVGSAVFAVPPGCPEGGYVGQALLEG